MFLKDRDQARKMLNMRIKIDVWSKGMEESIRDEIRENLRELFCQLPPHRVWHYLKNIRYLQLSERIKAEDIVDGPEDVIANCTFNQESLFFFLHFRSSKESNSDIISTSTFPLEGPLPSDVLCNS
jgi:hypothetical protein